MISSPAALDFTVTADRIAGRPPEARGLRRDEVKLLVAGPNGVTHTRFVGLGHHLRPTDLLVVNTSPTMPAALDAHLAGEPIVVHLSTRHDDGSWTIELRRVDGQGPFLEARPGDLIDIPGGTVGLLHPADDAGSGAVRLWRATVATTDDLRRILHRHGRPIRYAYVRHNWPLRYYQTLFADHGRWPGSAEMPSAGRPFSNRLLRSLSHLGIGIMPIRLDTSVSSQESHELPQPESYVVPRSTAAAIDHARSAGGRIVAVGTTVARALETLASPGGLVVPGSGWTNLLLGSTRPARVVDGIITGWHPAQASHLQLLEAVVGPDLVRTVYEAALANRYLWHEFGDAALLLR